jgi:ABC-type nitrate/sulfonate/bicarbonate transport system substrate-binding protein
MFQKRAAALMAALLFVSASVRSSAQPLIPVKLIVYGAGIGSWCVYAAKEQHFFADAGIDVGDPLVVIGDPNIVSGLMSGQAQIAAGGVASLLPDANGQTDQLVLIGGIERSPVALITKTSVTSPQQLVGTTIALPGHNTSNEVIGSALVDALVGKGKWTPLYIGGASTSRVAAVAVGKAAAAYVNEPVDVHSLGGDFHIMTRFGAKQIYTNGGVITTRNWLRANPDTAERFLAGLARGCNFINDPKNRAAAVDILVRHQPIAEPAADDAYAYYVLGPDRGRTPPTDARLDVQGTLAVFGLLKDAGIITNKSFDPRKVIDLSYLDKALKSKYFKH